MNPWIVAGLCWAIVSIPIAIVIGSLIRAGMTHAEERQEHEAHQTLQVEPWE